MNAPAQKEISAITAVVALTLPERAAVAMLTAEHELKLRALVASSADIVAVIDAPGREQAHRIGMNLKGACVAIEKVGKTAREDATAFSKAIIVEEKRLIAIAEPEKLRVLALRDGFDDAEQARKDALIAAERARTDAIQADIQTIRDIPSKLILKPSAMLAEAIDALRKIEVTAERFAEFVAEADIAIEDADYALVQMHGTTKGAEIDAHATEVARIAEAARMAAAAEQLAIDQAALAEQKRVAKVESDRIAAAQIAEAARLAELTRQTAANLQAERDAMAEQQRLVRLKAAAEQAERDRITAEAQKKMDAQQAAITAQLAELTRAQDEAIARKEAEIKLDADHFDGLGDNAIIYHDLAIAHSAALDMNGLMDGAALLRRLSYDREQVLRADLARCESTAQAMLTNGRSLVLENANPMDFSLVAPSDTGFVESDDPFIDYEAIAWAYAKLLAFGVGNTSMENAMMLDRLNAMLVAA